MATKLLVLSVSSARSICGMETTWKERNFARFYLISKHIPMQPATNCDKLLQQIPSMIY